MTTTFATPCLVKLPEAMAIAQRAADSALLPQTVFRAQDSHGYTNIHAYADRLEGRDSGLHMAVTLLPSIFFTKAWRGE